MPSVFTRVCIFHLWSSIMVIHHIFFLSPFSRGTNKPKNYLWRRIYFFGAGGCSTELSSTERHTHTRGWSQVSKYSSVDLFFFQRRKYIFLTCCVCKKKERSSLRGEHNMGNICTHDMTRAKSFLHISWFSPGEAHTEKKNLRQLNPSFFLLHSIKTSKTKDEEKVDTDGAGHFLRPGKWLASLLLFLLRDNIPARKLFLCLHFNGPTRWQKIGR